jgi:chorismate synthase
MIRYLTSGESHGKGLTTVVEGLPANLPLEKAYIDKQLARRQMGYGRGGRMKIETDQVEILSGVRFERTLGSPVALWVKNRDWENWVEKMSPEGERTTDEVITIPRPGHADLVGATKFQFDDIRNSIERSSARETAARVAACTTARKLLSELGVKVGSFVESVGGVFPENSFGRKLLMNEVSADFDAETIAEEADASEVRALEKPQEEKIIEKITDAMKRGDTLGGTFYVVATGLPVGLGSYMHFDRKLDMAIARDIQSINAVKGSEIGAGFRAADWFGSETHDEIVLRDGRLRRRTNRAGGLEGGITTGEPIIVRAAMKPISTLMSPIGTVDLDGMKPIQARRERSDFTAVPACAVVAEAVLSMTLANFVLEKFGGDSIEELKERFVGYQQRAEEALRKKFSR